MNKQKRTCYICKELVNNWKRPSINKVRYYLCNKETCRLEFEKLKVRTNPLLINNEPKKIFDKLIKKTNINVDELKYENTLKELIWKNMKNQTQLKQNLYLYGINKKNIEYLNILCKKYSISKTSAINMLIEFFRVKNNK